MSKIEDKKRKIEATARGIEQMSGNNDDTRYKLNPEEEALRKRIDAAKPSLLKRIGVALLDLLFAAILAGGLFVFSYFVVFPNIGYTDASQELVSAYTESHLYNIEDGKFVLISESYNDSKTPEENYDIPLLSFYSENPRALAAEKLQQYHKAKLDSGFYQQDPDNEYKTIRIEGVSGSKAKLLLELEYNKAIDFLVEDPEIIAASQITYYTMILSILIVVSISSVTFYIVVPLIDKRRRTLAYMIGGIMPVDNKSLEPVDMSRILIRGFIFIVLTFISPITLYIWAGNMTFSFIPLFVNIAILSFSHSNSGLHDFSSRVIVLNRSLSNPFENLKAITGQGEQQ